MTRSDAVRRRDGSLEATLDVTDAVPVGVGITDAVAAAADVHPLALPPVHDAVDTDALDDFFARSPDTAGYTVRFRYAGYRVTVRDTDDSVVVTVFDCSLSAPDSEATD
mgnify:CR=1 FL=1